MDYLDAKKELRQRIILLVGYVLVGVAITIATLILLYQAYGFGLGKDGTVIQNGLTFFSSQPNPADIYANGKLQSAKTNTRLVLPSGIYQMKLTREGYRDWQRTIDVQGGKVQHYDYPFLFPKTLSPKKLQSFAGTPGFTTQSPDRRWLLIQPTAKLSEFTLHDLKNPAEAPTALTLPDNLLSKATTSEAWQLGEWAGDNRRVLLQHSFDGKVEFILVDRDEPALSLNLSQTLGFNPVKLTLNDKKYDKYYSYDPATARLQSFTLNAPTPVIVLERVLAYQTYSDDTVLYVTDSRVSGTVDVKLKIGDRVTTVRSLPASPGYVLDLTKYDDVMYVAAGATSGSRVYIYKDPAGQRARLPDQAPVPSQVLHVEQPNYLSFSANAQFIVAENGNRFGVYDIENETGYNFTTVEPLDPPQTHASWMDGNRLMYVSAGKLIAFDYDNNNHQTLVAAGSTYLPAFTPNFKFVYTLAPLATGFDLHQTPLLIPADQ